MTPPSAQSRWTAEKAMRENAPALLRFLARRTESPCDAADILNDALLVVWRRRDEIPEAPTEARMWMFRVAANTLRSHDRSRRRRSRLNAKLTAYSDPHSGDVDPATRAERADLRMDVRAALEALKPQDRELVMLVNWDGFTLAEAADLLRINPSTARTKYARARATMSPLLTEWSSTVATPDLRVREPRYSIRHSSDRASVAE